MIKNNNMLSKFIYLSLLYFHVFLRNIKPYSINKSLLSINRIFILTCLFPTFIKGSFKEGYIKRDNKYVSVVAGDKIKLTNDKVTLFLWNSDKNFVRVSDGDKYLFSEDDDLKLQKAPQEIKVIEGKQKENKKTRKKQLLFFPEHISMKNLIFNTEDNNKENDSSEDNETNSENKVKNSNSHGEQESSSHDVSSEHETNQEDMNSNESNKSEKQNKKSRNESKKRSKNDKKTKNSLKSSKKDEECPPNGLYVSSSENEIQPDDKKKRKPNNKKTEKSKKPNMKEAFNKAKDVFMDNSPIGKFFSGHFKSALLDNESEEGITGKSNIKNLKKNAPLKKQITNNKHHNYLKSKTRYNKGKRNSLNNDTTEKLMEISRLVDKFRESLKR